MDKIIIGCLGRARHGKGTIASISQTWFQERGIAAQVISFADPLKDFLTLVVGRREPFRGNDAERNTPLPEISWSILDPDLVAEALKSWPNQDLKINPTGRQLMQLFGTEVIRKRFFAQCWIMMAAGRAKLFDGITIIDDVRFPNEARTRTDGGIIDVLFKAFRPGAPVISHPSEDAVDTVPLDTVNKLFVNDKDIGALTTDVYTWLDTYLGERFHADRESVHQESAR